MVVLQMHPLDLARLAAVASLSQARTALTLAQRQAEALGRELPADVVARIRETRATVEQLAAIIGAPPRAN